MQRYCADTSDNWLRQAHQQLPPMLETTYQLDGASRNGYMQTDSFAFATESSTQDCMCTSFYSGLLPIASISSHQPAAGNSRS